MDLLTGIDRVVYGVADLVEAKQFFCDWGLALVDESAEQVTFETLEKSQVVIKHMHDPNLPAPIEDGPTVREVVWGAASEEALETFLSGISEKIELTKGDDGIVRCLDPNGLSVGFKVTNRVRADVKGTPCNTYDKAYRIDKAAPVYERAQPTHLAHVVFFVEDLEAHREFYINTLGFQITDEYPGRGFFSRCVSEGTHHNMFLLTIPNRKKGVNHVSFGLRDLYEVVGGGLYFSSKNWENQMGPGRHPISSAFFWYFQSPGGGLVEYYSDEDYLTSEWQARMLEPTPENYAEWAVQGGLDAKTRRQKMPETV